VILTARRLLSEGPTFALWLALNLLNVADALLTHVAVTAGVAREANPLVDAIGLGGKVLLVAVLGTALALLRPNALWVPVAALAAVVVYSSVGLALHL
jgi:hypothetical protein